MKPASYRRKVAVLGAGVMGAQIAAHLVQCRRRHPALRPGRPRKATRTASCSEGASPTSASSHPAPLASQGQGRRDHPGELRAAASRLSSPTCDLIIEAIAEKMEWKKDLYREDRPARGAACHAVAVEHLGPGRSMASPTPCRPRNCVTRFCGVHFFNPPRYMHLAELIPCKGHGSQAMLEGLETFLTTTLGKGVVIRQGHAELHRQPHRRVLDPVRACIIPSAFGLGFDEVDARHRPADRPPEVGDLPHLATWSASTRWRM